MKNIFKIISVLSVIAIILTTSCSEKERTWLGDLQTGAYLQFVTVPDLIQGVNTIDELVYEGTLVDPTGNVVSYELTISAVLSGVAYGPVVLNTWTTFPINLAIPVAEMATAIGVDVADINFGDSFAFTAEVTHRNGTVYTSEPISFEDGVLEEGGRTNPEVLRSTNGYRNGLIFGFTIGCPGDSYSSATIDGDYRAYSASWPADGTITLAVDGTDTNVIWVTGIPELDGFTGDRPAKWTVDPATNEVTIDDSIQLMDTPFYGYSGMYISGRGTIFPCAGNKFLMDIRYSVDAGSFGVYGYEITAL